jgi:hypothetical protein
VSCSDIFASLCLSDLFNQFTVSIGLGQKLVLIDGLKNRH